MCDIEEILTVYGDMLFRIAFVQLGNRADAEDAVQDSLLKYIKKKPGTESQEHLKAWLIKVLLNTCKDELRRRKFRFHDNIEDVDGDAVIYADNESDEGEILNSLITLPEKYSSVMMLYYVEGYKIKHIARIIGVSESAVKMRLKKGRALFKEICLKEDLI